jgi:hypothetical protein
MLPFVLSGDKVLAWESMLPSDRHAERTTANSRGISVALRDVLD